MANDPIEQHAAKLIAASFPVDFEELRRFIIEHALTITDESGLAIDVVDTESLVEWYEQHTSRTFYRRPEFSPPTCDETGHYYATGANQCYCDNTGMAASDA